MADTPILEFDVIIDTSLKELDEAFSSNQHLMSLTNRFESGAWRESKFVSFLMDNLVLTALSKEERDKMLGGNAFSALQAAARNLRMVDNDRGKGGEIAEILLYGIMSKYFNALPVIPKVFYKQNTQDNAKGSDSVHIVLDGDEGFTLWLGEAKFYNSIKSDRLDDPVNSVLTALTTHALRKETTLLMGYKDLGLCVENQDLLNKIKRYLSLDTSLDDIKKVLHVPIMLLHECEVTKAATSMTEDFKSRLISKHKECAIAFFKKLNSKHTEIKNDEDLNGIFLFDRINFHLILFPAPSKDSIVNRFYGNAEFLRK